MRKRRGFAVGVATTLVVAAAGGAAALMLRPSASARSATADAARGAIVVTSDPPGAAIWVNGDLRPEVTPATVSQLPTGRSLDVKLTKDGFERASAQILLTDGEPRGAITIALKRGSVSIDVACKQAGAECPRVGLLLDGKPFPGTTIDGVTSGEPHNLIVSVPGFSDQTFAFSGSPFEKKHFDVIFDHVAGEAAPAGSPRHSSRGGAAATPAPQPAGNGKLNVGATGGWCNVTVDGVARGATPIAGIDVGSGAHRITCAPPDGKTQSATVNVPADGTTRYRFTLAP